MIGIRSLAAVVLGLTLMISAGAKGVVVGLLYVGPENQAGLAVERSAEGDLFLLLDMNDNARRIEFGISPGTAFRSEAVSISPNGQPLLVLSIYSGEEQGLVNSGNVSLIDPARARTHQRTNLSQDLRELERAGGLRDENGKTYSLDEIKEIALVFQVKQSGAFDTSLSAGLFLVDELPAGRIQQLAGERVATTEGDRARAIAALDEVRTQELPYEIVKSKIEDALLELGYSSADAEQLAQEMLDFRNNGVRAAEILARHDARKR